jgi:hypothetical protein
MAVETCCSGALIKINDRSRTQYIIYCLRGETGSLAFDYETSGSFQNTGKNKIPNGYRALLCRYHQSLQIGYVANNGANRSKTHVANSVMGRIEWLKQFRVRWCSFSVSCNKRRERWRGNGKERTWTCKTKRTLIKYEQTRRQTIVKGERCRKIYKIPTIKIVRVWSCWRNVQLTNAKKDCCS